MRVCAECFDDQELKDFIGLHEECCKPCEGCGSSCVSIDIEEIEDFLTSYLRAFQQCEDGDKLLDLMQKWRVCSGKSAERILGHIIESNKLELDLHKPGKYIEKLERQDGIWAELKNQVKNSRRYIIEEEKLEWLEGLISLAIEKPKGETYYRARINPQADKGFDKNEMGAPPREKAALRRKVYCQTKSEWDSTRHWNFRMGKKPSRAGNSGRMQQRGAAQNKQNPHHPRKLAVRPRIHTVHQGMRSGLRPFGLRRVHCGGLR